MGNESRDGKSRQGVLMGLGAVGAGVLASACCIGPAVFAALGLGALGAGSALEAWRPWLLGMTFVLLGSGLFLAYREREVACADGSCRRGGAGRGARAALWSIAVLALIGALYPQIRTAVAGTCCDPPAVAGTSRQTGSGR